MEWQNDTKRIVIVCYNSLIVCSISATICTCMDLQVFGQILSTDPAYIKESEAGNHWEQHCTQKKPRLLQGALASLALAKLDRSSFWQIWILQSSKLFATFGFPSQNSRCRTTMKFQVLPLGFEVWLNWNWKLLQNVILIVLIHCWMKDIE